MRPTWYFRLFSVPSLLWWSMCHVFFKGAMVFFLKKKRNFFFRGSSSPPLSLMLCFSEGSNSQIEVIHCFVSLNFTDWIKTSSFFFRIMVKWIFLGSIVLGGKSVRVSVLVLGSDAWFMSFSFHFWFNWQILPFLLKWSVNPDALNHHKQVILVTFDSERESLFLGKCLIFVV